MAKPITYGKLHRFLLKQGFEDCSVAEAHAGFRHRESNTLILLAIHAVDEPVVLLDLRKIRHMLDWKGLVAAEEFDQFVAKGKAPAAKSKRTKRS